MAVGALVLFRYLDVSNNLLTGSIPPSWTAFATLSAAGHLFLNNNHLSGSVPTQLLVGSPINSTVWSSNCITGAANPLVGCALYERQARAAPPCIR